MKKIVSLFVFFALTAAAVVHAGDLNVNSAPPIVVTTLPAAGAKDVDPTTKAVKVTFNKDMKTNNQWSWVKVSNGTFPEMAGQPYFEKDKRTCVLPVSLKPGISYSIWINSDKHNNFRDTNNQPAVPYLLVFETKK